MMLAACSSIGASQANQMTNTHAQRVVDAKLLSGTSIDVWPIFGYDAGHTGFEGQRIAHRMRGNLLWSKKIGPIFSSAVAGLGMLFIASTDGYLYALKENTGALAWHIPLGDYLTDATPALEGRGVFLSRSRRSLRVLNAYTRQASSALETHE